MNSLSKNLYPIAYFISCFVLVIIALQILFSLTEDNSFFFASKQI